MTSKLFSPAVLKARFNYDPATGALTRRPSGKPAVYVKLAPCSGRPAAYVAMSRSYLAAAHVIYALLHGVSPVGVRTRFLDGDPTNLRQANLQFGTNTPGTPGRLRAKPVLLKLLADLGGRASSAELRRRGGFNRTISSTLRLLEAEGHIHAVGLDQSEGVRSYLWQLGPGERSPQARWRAAEPAADEKAAECDDERDAQERDAARRATMKSIDQARRGLVANSVFGLAGGGG